jgi:hypothetical protein
MPLTVKIIIIKKKKLRKEINNELFNREGMTLLPFATKAISNRKAIWRGGRLK